MQSFSETQVDGNPRVVQCVAKMAPNVVCRPHVVEAKSMGQQKGRKVTIGGGHEADHHIRANLSGS